MKHLYVFLLMLLMYFHVSRENWFGYKYFFIILQKLLNNKFDISYTPYVRKERKKISYATLKLSVSTWKTVSFVINFVIFTFFCFEC